MNMKWTLLILIVMMFGNVSYGDIVSKDVEYTSNGTVLQGYLAYDNSISGKRPGILVVHEWTGLNDYAKERTRMLAELGYVAFAADIYGKGIRPQNREEAAEQASKYKGDRSLLRERVNAGLERLRKFEQCDTAKLGAIGYCFGGTTVLELARSGANIGGVVSFHGGLDTPTPEDARNIKCRVLACHGADDPYEPTEQVLGFWDEMRNGKVDWEMNIYGNAVHGFTNPHAGNEVASGYAYNEKADKRSWKDMQQFFDELFKK